MNWKKTTILGAVFLGMILLPAYGQKGFDDDKKGLRMYSTVGYQMFNFDDFNTQLTDNGYPEISGDMFSLGMMWQGMKKNWLMRSELHLLFSQSGENDTYLSSASGLYGFMDYGYLIANNIRYEFAPIVGVGLGGMMVSLNETQTTDFGTLLDNPSGLQVYKGSVLFKAGLDFAYLIRVNEDNYGKRAMSLGIDAGYILDPFDASWRMKGVELSGGPDSNFGGPYVRLTLGIGFYARESKINID